MPRQEGDERDRRARGGVRPEPAEGLPVRHETGAQLEARARVHSDPAGDVQPQVHAAPKRAKAAHFRVVPRRLAAGPGPGALNYDRLQNETKLPSHGKLILYHPISFGA